MKKKYKGIVIGCGKIGAQWDTREGRVVPRSHAGAFARGKNTVLVALVDPDPVRLKEAGNMFPHAHLYSDAAEALTKEKPDIVAIATPPKTHIALAKLAIHSKVKMIICEKPLAPNAREAVSLGKILSVQNAPTFVLNFQRRFWKLFERIRLEIENGKIGEIQQVTAYYDNGLYNTGAHALDAILFLLGDRAIQASGLFNGKITTHPQNDPDIDGIIETEKGSHIVLQGFDKSDWGILELHIYGKKGVIRMTEHGFTAERFIPARRQTIPVFIKKYSIRRRESFVGGAHEEVIRCYEKKLNPRSGFINGMEVLSALDALTKSASQGGKMVKIQYIA